MIARHPRTVALAMVVGAMLTSPLAFAAPEGGARSFIQITGGSAARLPLALPEGVVLT